MTSTPNILGSRQRRQNSEEKAHHPFKVQCGCPARTSGTFLRAPLLPAGSALLRAFCMLEPTSVSSPGPSHATDRGQLLCFFQSFYSALAQAGCYARRKKQNQKNQITSKQKHTKTPNKTKPKAKQPTTTKKTTE